VSKNTKTQLIEIILPKGRGNDIRELLYEHPLENYWRDALEDNQTRIRILLQVGVVEPVLDILDSYLKELPDAKAILLPVEAIVPRPESKEPETESEQDQDDVKRSNRISRHELYDDIIAGCTLSSTYLAMVFLSAVIAAIGLVRGDMAIIIGAMVLAPLLTPNVALALANTLGDTELAVTSIKTAAAGLTLAVIIGFAIGIIFPADPAIPAIAARTQFHWSDLLLALASGSAGVLALTSAGQLSLIGVMVAVALMPPLVTAGLMFGSGYVVQGFGALQLALANVICVNLAGIVTFLIQGIRPATWWESSRAKKAVKKSLFIWISLLMLLALLLTFE
jgi:uncharacterized hydrophobic protein (TIGR00341 family)